VAASSLVMPWARHLLRVASAFEWLLGRRKLEVCKLGGLKPNEAL